MYPASASGSSDSSKCLTIRTLMKVASDELLYALAKYNGNLRISHCIGLGSAEHLRKMKPITNTFKYPGFQLAEKISDTKQLGYKIAQSHYCISNSLCLQWRFSYPKIKSRSLASSALRKTERQRTFSWDEHASPLLTDIQLHTCTYQAMGEVSSNVGVASATQLITG